LTVETPRTIEPTRDALAAAEAAPATSIVQTAEHRRAALNRALQVRGALGWRLVARSDFQATIVKGNRLNNTLHLILTIITVGLWGIVWILLALFGGIKRRVVTIDEYGNFVNNEL
jgi:hypothetical protein